MPWRHVRHHAAAALQQIGPAAAEAMPALVIALGDPDKYIQWMALKALERIGPVAVPALVAALNDPLEVVRQNATEALKKIRESS
jgi:HEAT repeat protein